MADETRKANDPDVNDRSANRDPITGAPGSHPVGTGIGAAGAGAAGAAIGSMAGPIGTAVGAVVGAVAGGLAGKGVAENVNPTAEDEYWRNNYRSRPYVTPGSKYEDYQSAYQSGWESSGKYSGQRFEDVESNLRSDWESRNKGKASLEWDRAKNAMRDAWDRVHPVGNRDDRSSSASSTRGSSSSSGSSGSSDSGVSNTM